MSRVHTPVGPSQSLLADHHLTEAGGGRQRSGDAVMATPGRDDPWLAWTVLWVVVQSLTVVLACLFARTWLREGHFPGALVAAVTFGLGSLVGWVCPAAGQSRVASPARSRRAR